MNIILCTIGIKTPQLNQVRFNDLLLYSTFFDDGCVYKHIPFKRCAQVQTNFHLTINNAKYPIINNITVKFNGGSKVYA